jgi:hypothetical protein
MPAELLPTGRDPLRRLGTMSLVTGLLGLLAIVYTMVNFARGHEGPGEEWLFGVGFCLLFGAVAASLIQGVLLSYGARIEALEKRASADTNCPADGSGVRVS